MRTQHFGPTSLVSISNLSHGRAVCHVLQFMAYSLSVALQWVVGPADPVLIPALTGCKPVQSHNMDSQL